MARDAGVPEVDGRPTEGGLSDRKWRRHSPGGITSRRAGDAGSVGGGQWTGVVVELLHKDIKYQHFPTSSRARQRTSERKSEWPRNYERRLRSDPWLF